MAGRHTASTDNPHSAIDQYSVGTMATVDVCQSSDLQPTGALDSQVGSVEMANPTSAVVTRRPMDMKAALCRGQRPEVRGGPATYL